MTYELCKKLKEAEFPQNIKAGDNYYKCIGHPRMRILHQWAKNTSFIDLKDIVGQKDWVKIPILSELIEACGDSQLTLEHTQRTWYAWCRTENSNIDNREEIGQTPEEAVARL